MYSRFLLVQIGFGVSRATEAAAHASRAYVTGFQPGQGLLKLDFKNIFNIARRNTMFQIVFNQCIRRQFQVLKENMNDEEIAPSGAPLNLEEKNFFVIILQKCSSISLYYRK
jgi:hypothetical protein